MNSLLQRQLRQRRIGDVPADPWGGLLETVSATYDELEQERRHLEHTLAVTSAELNEANQQLRSEAESQLRLLNLYYQRTLEGQQGMILRIREQDGDFVHTLCRGQLAARLGWTPERVEGRRLGDFLPSAAADALRAAYRRAWEGQECTFEGESPDRGISYLALLQPRPGEGAAREVIISAVEITDRKRVEIELRQAKDRAESADRSKSEFLAVMSHEIRTPLNAILGFTHLLLENCPDPQQAQWIRTIDQSGRSLQALINDILDFSKIEVGRLELVSEPVAIVEVLQSVVALFRPAAAEKGLEISLQLEPGLPGLIRADPLRLRQIMANLVSNAVKFTKRGTVAVSVAQRHPPPGGGRPQIRFSVRDTGIGIPESARDSLFKPFTQVDSSATRSYGGTGLGLAISRRLASAMGGSLDYVSEPDRGSTFSLILPSIEEAAAPAPAPRPAAASPADLTKMRVLVAEDNPANQLLISELFRKFGLKPCVVGDGQAAINAVAASPYDLVFMDVHMPKVDGLAATRAIRASEPHRRMRIVALTASVQPEQTTKCLSAGMDAVLNKPLVFAEILREMAFASHPPDQGAGI
jgi:signal transduction histidine kinase/ActR/RegA family two-component response regulator